MKKIKKYKKYIICFILIILSITGIIIQKNQKIVINDKKINSDDKDSITIYITGAVNNPGVYSIKKEERVDKIIEASGGVTEDADLNNINFAKQVIDGEKIYIPYKEIILKDDNMEYEENSNDNIKININKASKEELMTLDGIGESSANNIILYRKVNKFEFIEDIMKVKGIGKAKYEKIKDLLEV